MLGGSTVHSHRSERTDHVDLPADSLQQQLHDGLGHLSISGVGREIRPVAGGQHNALRRWRNRGQPDSTDASPDAGTASFFSNRPGVTPVGKAKGHCPRSDPFALGSSAVDVRCVPGPGAKVGSQAPCTVRSADQGCPARTALLDPWPRIRVDVRK